MGVGLGATGGSRWMVVGSQNFFYHSIASLEELARAEDRSFSPLLCLTDLSAAKG